MKLERLFARALAAALAVPAGAGCTSRSGELPPLSAECNASHAFAVPFDGAFDTQLGPAFSGPFCNSYCADAGDAGLDSGCGCSQFATCQPADASVACNLQYVCPGGRRAEGATFASAMHLGHLAALERASITAFSTLRRELRAHRAPSSLLRACSRARRDEIRHTRAISALARRAGEVVPPVVVTPIAVRSLEAIAVENVVEGCVRETFGALVATWQAMHATDREVAVIMKRIAREESQHAALAWKVHRWMEPRLDRAGRARVARARLAAIETLTAEIANEPEIQLRRALGLPSSGQARAMVATLAAA